MGSSNGWSFAKDGHNFVNVGEVTPEAQLRRVRIYEFDDAYHLLQRLEQGFSLDAELHVWASPNCCSVFLKEVR